MGGSCRPLSRLDRGSPHLKLHRPVLSTKVTDLCRLPPPLVPLLFLLLHLLLRETKKFEKRLCRGSRDRDGLVPELPRLEALAARYVQLCLGQGAVQRLAEAFSR